MAGYQARTAPDALRHDCERRPLLVNGLVAGFPSALGLRTRNRRLTREHTCTQCGCGGALKRPRPARATPPESASTLELTLERTDAVFREDALN